MMRRWVNRVQDGCAAAVRDQLGGLQAAVEETVSARVDDLRRDMRLQQAALDVMGRTLREERAVLAGALDRLAGVLECLTGALEHERRDRVAQVEFIEGLLRELLISRPASVPARLLGGSIDPAPPISELETIDLRLAERAADDELKAGTPVQVRSQFEDHWTDGFSISEVQVEDGRRRLRLTRRSDGTTLPVWFDAADVRPLMAPPLAPALGEELGLPG